MARRLRTGSFIWLFGRAEEGVAFRDIAGVIARHLDVPLVGLSREEADAHFGLDVPIAGLDIPSLMRGSGAQTQELLDWPAQPGLIADLEQGHYFKS